MSVQRSSMSKPIIQKKTVRRPGYVYADGAEKEPEFGANPAAGAGTVISIANILPEEARRQRKQAEVYNVQPPVPVESEPQGRLYTPPNPNNARPAPDAGNGTAPRASAHAAAANPAAAAARSTAAAPLRTADAKERLYSLRAAVDSLSFTVRTSPTRRAFKSANNSICCPA